MENFKSFAASVIIVEEYEERLSLISESVKLDDVFITAPKVTNEVLNKFIKSRGEKTIVTTDGKYAVSGWTGYSSSATNKLAYIVIADTTNFGKASDAWFITNTANEFIDAINNGLSGIDELIKLGSAKKAGAFSIWTFNPYAKHNFGAYTKTYPYAGYNRIKIEDVFAMFFNNQIASVWVDNETYDKPAQAFVAFLSHYDSFNGKIVGTGDGEFNIGTGRWAIHVKLDASKFSNKKKAVKSSNEAPADLKIGNETVKVGDWLAYSIHYSFLAGADAFMIVGFNGKSTILVQEYNMLSKVEDGGTKTITVDPKLTPVGGVVPVRVGKTGSVKFGSNYARLYKDWKTIKFSGSAWD